MYTYIEVEANDNCPMSANQVFKNLTNPVRVVQVKIFEGSPEPQVYDVIGWSSEAAAPTLPAYAAQVEDSSAGTGWLVYGGDWGVRLRPAGSDEDWDLASAAQYGETHLVLADESDLIFLAD